MEKEMDRRDFLKKAAAGAAVLTATACTAGKVGNGRTSSDDEQLGEMEYRTNQATGDKVSLLGYGCMRWPMVTVDDNEVIDQEKVNEMVDYALEHGVNYFDASPVYLKGLCEEAAGVALSRHPRSSYFVATKMSNFSNSTFENSVLMYRKSMEHFRTDYIDYYLLHNLRGEEAFNKRFVDNGIMDFLVEERKAGRIRNLGFSFHGSLSDFDRYMELHDTWHWDFVQIQMNYYDWNSKSGKGANAKYLYDQAKKHNIPVVVMEPLLGGRLSSVPEHIAESFLERRPSDSIASWAFRFAGTPDGVLTVLSGMSVMEHLKDNLKTYCSFEPLSADDLEFLESRAALLRAFPSVPCNYCNYCMPCPYGIDIPGMFKHYNKCVEEGMVVTIPEYGDEELTIEQKEERRKFKELRRKYLISYSRAIPAIRQAGNCISCGQCKSACPQHIDIPSQMIKIDRYVEKLKSER